MPSIEERTRFLAMVLLRAGLFSLGASVLVGALLIARSRVNATGDVIPFLFWTVLFALGIVVVSIPATRLFSRLPTRLLSYPLAIVLGTFVSFAFGVVASLFWIFGGFSFPVGFAWMAGGISGLVAVAGVGSRAQKGNLLLESVLAGLVCFGLAFNSDAFIVRLFDERQIDIVWVKWKPGPEQLVLDKRLMDYLTDEEQTHLLTMNLGGHLIWKGTGGEGQRGPKSRMVIVMQQQLKEPIKLLLPERWVIYVQEQNGWRKEPPGAPTVRKTLGLEIDTNSPQVTRFVWEYPGGISHFGGFDWSESDP